MNRNGGVEPRFLPSLTKLYQRETQLERKLVLMAVLKRSPSGTLTEAVRTQKIIGELQQWLISSTESKDFRLSLRVIEILDKLPIDLAALQVRSFSYPCVSLLDPFLSVSLLYPFLCVSLSDPILCVCCLDPFPCAFF